MKAIVYSRYGSPDVLQLTEVAQPTPKADEVLVKVRAASINSWDWDLLTGKPYVYRPLFGLFKPKLPILGADIAGVVEAVGRNVTQFKPGDEVFGDLSACGWGGFAGYVCARENALALKSASLTFPAAAAIPQAAILALQGLRDQGRLQKGQKVLVNGAGGGVGTFAVQIAKAIGAEVTGVDLPGKLDRLRALGTDHVLAYTEQDFSRTGLRYDLILDVACHRSIFDSQRALGPEGKYIMIGGAVIRILQLLLVGPLITLTTNKKMGILVHKPKAQDLAFMNGMVERGEVTPVIDRCYPLSEVPAALRYFGAGQAQGKIVITVDENS
jgi:NADPH:quinone reductase-like Zn-dependent oxidoreductase